MKILHLGKFYYPFLGGIETQLKVLAEGQVARGHEVTVLCSGHGISRKVEMIRGVRVVRSPYFGKLFSQPLNFFLPFDLMRESRNADIVQVHSPNPLMEALALFLPSRLPVIDAHHSDIFRQRLLRFLYGPIHHLFYGKCKKIVVATANHLKYSTQLGRFSSRTEVIPYAIEDKPLELSRAIEGRAQEIQYEMGDFALFVGRLVEYKGVHVLIEALKNVPHLKLAIMGGGPEEPRLKEQVHALGLSDRVFFLGAITDEVEHGAWFCASKMFVLPSIHPSEAFGMVLLEAMAWGIPCISTRLESGVPWVNEEGVSGLHVNPNDVTALAQAMEKINGDSDLCGRLGEGARKRVQTQFGPALFVDSYLSLYEKLLTQ